MAETERSNLPIAEEPEFTTEIQAIRPDDPVHFAQMNAMLESLLGNDVFLKNLANKMLENSLIAHVLDCENPQMVLGADQGPVITGLIDEVKGDITQLYSDMSVRYDQESDYVQLYNGASWINWMQGGLQFLNFLRLAENQWDIRDNNASHTFEIANGKLSMTAVPKTDGGNIIADCTYPVDLTNKKRITIKGRVYLYTTAQAVISIGSYRYTTPQAPSKWVDISTIGDLSDLSGVSELGITLPCYEGYTASQIQLTTLLIE